MSCRTADAGCDRVRSVTPRQRPPVAASIGARQNKDSNASGHNVVAVREHFASAGVPATRRTSASQSTSIIRAGVTGIVARENVMTRCRMVTDRNFNLADALLLVAFTAPGIAWTVGYSREGGYVSPHEYGYRSFVWHTVCRSFSFLLLAWTVAFVPLRLRKPRPGLRWLCRRSGTCACSAVLIIGVWSYGQALVRWGTLLLAPSDQLFAPGVDRPFVETIWFELAEPTKQLSLSAGSTIIAIWTILAVSGRIRRGIDWVDKFGFYLGVGWIFLLWEDVLNAALYATG